MAGRMQCLPFLVVFTLFVTLCSAACDTSSFMNAKFARCQTLNNYYDVYWNVEGDDLHLALNLQTNQNGDSYQNGWVGFGVSINGGMRGADIALARVVKGQYVLEDRFVPGKEGEPKIDAHQNLQLISASSDDVSTTIEYKRKLKSCDVDEDVPISNQGSQVIFAWGAGDVAYHGLNRGSTTIFFHYQQLVGQLPDDAQTVSLLMPAYNVPAKDTTYTCTPVVLPADKKYQVVRWRPNISPASAAYVHHIVIFVCPTLPPTNDTYECGMAPLSCTQVMLAWSLGQEGNDWLDDFAMPMGAGFAQYAYLQIHYNNPFMVGGVVDSSGIDLTYTAILRKYDIGSIIISTNMGAINIAPQTLSYEQWAECPSECTSKFEQPLTMIGYFPHMHQIGQQIWTQHIRGDVELNEIHRDNHYDFQRQQSYPVNVTLIPGDRLRVHCIWNSMDRAANTTGGESSSQEMCVALIQYYPRSEQFISCFATGNIALCGNNNSRFTISPFPVYDPLPVPVTTCTESSTEDANNGNILSLPFVIGLVCMFISIIIIN